MSQMLLWQDLFHYLLYWVH